jgi:hypothetical protein
MSSIADIAVRLSEVVAAGGLPPADYLVHPGARNAGPPGLLDGAVLRALLAAAALAMVAAGILTTWIRRDRRRHGPAARALARAIGVRSAQWHLLQRLARVADLPDSGCLLISEGCFDAAAAAYRQRFGANPRLAALRTRLFA